MVPVLMQVLQSYAKAIARRALVLRDARQRLQNDPSPFQFLQLPFDIRLKVYEFAFINNQILEINHHTNYSHHSTCDHSIFGNDINTGLLLTNQQIFDEAEPMLYQTRFLNIGKHLDKGLQLLRNLSPRARENIRAVPIALPYLYESDGIRRGGFDFIVKAWCQLCYYMSQNLRIRALSFTASVEALPANFVDETWVQYLIKIRGLKHLMQCDLQPLTAMEWREFSDKFPESEPESEPESYKERKVLNSRLQALLSYLKSEMCQYPASRKLTEKEKEWYWIGNPREYLEVNEPESQSRMLSTNII